MKYKKSFSEHCDATWSEQKALDIAKTHCVDVDQRSVHWSETWKSTLTDSLAKNFLRGAMSELNSSIGFDETLCRAFAPKGEHVSETYEAQEERQATLEIYSALSYLSDYQLVAGDRMVMIKGLLEDVAGSEQYAKALPRALAVNTKKVAQEAKAAVLRYLALHENSLANSQLTSIFLAAAQVEEDVSALAAARALDDVADEGAASSIAATLPRVRSEAARTVMADTMERLNRGIRDDVFGKDA